VTFAPSFRRQAFLEFLAARRWYEKQRSGLGAEFEAELDRALSRACGSPHRYAEAIPGVRRVRVHRFPFTVYYRLRNEQLIVLAVFHSRRKPGTWRRRS